VVVTARTQLCNKDPSWQQNLYRVKFIILPNEASRIF